ncbi:spermine oxidase-like [Chironomus tepperi]|uniref:spermine oxidase-like n=1 Tax=Chironomus tepperi TaxID=113505 RepID=UPI00391F398C
MDLLKFLVQFSVFTIFSAVLANGQKEKDPKIVIIGAGLSGMAAATKLMDNGFNNIVVLEAENRIGGRIHSVNFSNGFIDLGAQWVHGVKNNVVYEINNGTYKFGVTGFDDKLPLFLQSNAIPVSQYKCENFAFLALENLFSNYNEMSQFNGSIGEFIIGKFKNSSFYQIPEDQELGDEMIDFYDKEMNIWNGSETWFDLSAKLHCVSGFNEGLQYLTWKRDGYKEFFKYLTKQVPTDGTNKTLNVMSKVYLNQEVTNIEWNISTSNYKYAIVTVNDQKKYYADHVIVTIPLGVLKARHESLFTPDLPNKLKRAIDGMGYGNIGKIFLEYDMPFWPNDTEWVGYGFLWTKYDIAAVKGTNKEWLLDLQMFIKVDKFPNVIEALLAGPHMRTFENLSSDVIMHDCVWLFQKFLGVILPRPKSMIKTSWLTSKNFLGSYSYFSMKTAEYNVTSNDLAETLFTPTKKPQIKFAGEHTDPAYSSNAHGAVNSGFRAAQEIIDYYS